MSSANENVVCNVMIENDSIVCKREQTANAYIIKELNNL